MHYLVHWRLISVIFQPVQKTSPCVLSIYSFIPSESLSIKTNFVFPHFLYPNDVKLVCLIRRLGSVRLGQREAGPGRAYSACPGDSGPLYISFFRLLGICTFDHPFESPSSLSAVTVYCDWFFDATFFIAIARSGKERERSERFAVSSVPRRIDSQRARRFIFYNSLGLFFGFCYIQQVVSEPENHNNFSLLSTVLPTDRIYQYSRSTRTVEFTDLAREPLSPN
ncbi:hypothetical protein M9H77_31226 [Catharanthus roseus]|uniref:Uncharacterized protein n=1 Tax=Catharanthus roseus TaxID=4058 RepID=A0ACB9ZZT8_CATRO|nr:hypothetical protein M9H77_31226 [Catharanthus roseus]